MSLEAKISELKQEIALIDQRVERLEHHYNRHAEILFNDGRGIAFRVRALEVARKQEEADGKKNNNHVYKIIAIVSALTSIVSVLLTIYYKIWK